LRGFDGVLPSLAHISRFACIIPLFIGGWHTFLGCTSLWFVEHHYVGGYGGVFYCLLITTLAILPRVHNSHGDYFIDYGWLRWLHGTISRAHLS
jgi:hypothetical protein